MRALWIGVAAAALLAACGEGPTGESSPAPTQQSARQDFAAAPDTASLPQRLKDGEVKPGQVVGTYLQRIELIDQSGPTLQSVIAVNPEAVAQARALEEAVASGEEPGALYGLPILVKDNIETFELPTTAGSLALKDNNTGRDAPVIARLRDAGAIILGKTNLSEWANFRSSQSVSGWSGVGGLSRNPHDLSRNTCGSSAGSGAAVAAGLAWGALGTETNGSVICPSASNGIVGFKPTVGLVSRSLVVPISPSQDTIGPMTTSVRDAAMILTAIAGTDERDAATAEADDRKTDYVAGLEGASLEGIRIGVLRWAQSDDPREQAVFDEALARAEAAGAILVDIDEANLNLSGGDAFTVLKAEFKESLNAYLAEAAPEVQTRTLADVIAFNEANEKEMSVFGQDILIDSEAMPGLDDEGYRTALSNAQSATREGGVDRFLEENDVQFLIAPSFGPAFKIDLVRGDIIANSAGAGWVAAIAGYPHLTLPMGDVSGLPLGLSIMSGKWMDAEVLAVGQAFEEILPPRLIPTFRASEIEAEGFAEAASPAR
ncbi:amidase [Parvularcula sp. ZS-1/3]|uniref:Amidase n=1 Tax=Parvularcula mediterranea TaxID=2732508 RepID=A0A7Y3RPK0_9PROT|nr:amidase [Parvularcula mediterranea]NNU17366.1 amidase [Parvularcula mediterranea]